MKDDLSRIEAQLTDDSYTGPYLSRIEMILKDMEPGGGGGIGFKGPYNSVSALPNPGEENYIYLVVSSDASTDYYDEYYWDTTHQTYTPMGTTKIQLEDYVKKSEVGTASAKNSTNAVTQNSTDLVESGAVYTAINTAIGNAVDNLLATSF